MHLIRHLSPSYWHSLNTEHYTNGFRLVFGFEMDRYFSVCRDGGVVNCNSISYSVSYGDLSTEYKKMLGKQANISQLFSFIVL